MKKYTCKLWDCLTIVPIMGIKLSQVVYVRFIDTPYLLKLLMELLPIPNRVVRHIYEPFPSLPI